MATTLQEFEAVFPSLVNDLNQHAQQYNLPPQSLEWLQKACSPLLHPFSAPRTDTVQSLNYNTLGGKCNRGLSVLHTTSLLSPSPLTPTQHHAACTLGWLTELLQAFFLVSDDIMDSSHTRRSQPCWFRLPSVGTIAINDAFMLESSIYILLKKHFRQHAAYVDFLELFHETSFQTEVGQLCDLLTAPEDNVNLDNFSLEKFTFIVIHKTAYYSFYLPVALSLHYLHLATPHNMQQAKAILIPLGEYFQIQDDYLDAYGSPETIGKIGTDIQDNKCSWLINQALQKASTSQRKVLEENYGRKDDGGETEARVKAVYRELELQKVYEAFEEKRVGEIREMIAKVDESEGLKKDVFESFLAKIYKRSK
ncbi:Farnesyl pyrophosphate synthetase [Schaereria dolodes]|nr:Farnesyl pyrophosphate synthetase [Schaereria dolodes]